MIPWPKRTEPAPALAPNTERCTARAIAVYGQLGKVMRDVGDGTHPENLLANAVGDHIATGVLHEVSGILLNSVTQEPVDAETRDAILGFCRQEIHRLTAKIASNVPARTMAAPGS